MTPYADLELTVEPEPVHVEEEPRSGWVIVYLLLAAAIVALGVGVWVVTRTPLAFVAGLALGTLLGLALGLLLRRDPGPRSRVERGAGRGVRRRGVHVVRVLVACEFSGIVRDAFAARGHFAVSCDLLPSERPGEHFQGDVRDVLNDNWDLLIAHPPCTHLAVSGARWFAEKQAEQAEALEFVRLLLDAPILRIALENPVSVISTRIRRPDQTIQPWMFGHGETKATCLWLKNLPPLVPTNIVEGREQRVHRMPPGPDRWRERSRTFPGIAAAMADQWGQVLDLGLTA